MLVSGAFLETISGILYSEELADGYFLNRDMTNAHPLFLRCGDERPSYLREERRHLLSVSLQITLLGKEYEEFCSALMKGKFCSTHRSMNDLLSRSDHHPAAPAQLPSARRSHVRLLGRFFSIFTGFVILLAFGSGALLLFNDTPLSLLQHLAHAPISAIPLLLIGLASLCFQVVTRPTLPDLFKACIVSTAFILWGIDQLLPTGWEATTLGDIVIVLYVIDLGWMMGDRLKERHKPALQETQPLPVQPAYCLHLLPLSPEAQVNEPLPVSDVPLWQRETQPGSPGSLREGTSSSSILKRHRLIPLRGADRR